MAAGVGVDAGDQPLRPRAGPRQDAQLVDRAAARSHGPERLRLAGGVLVGRAADALLAERVRRDVDRRREPDVARGGADRDRAPADRQRPTRVASWTSTTAGAA